MGLAASTQAGNLRYIEDLYKHADRLLGPSGLDDALTDMNDAAMCANRGLSRSGTDHASREPTSCAGMRAWDS
jgi:hypothetical protein